MRIIVRGEGSQNKRRGIENNGRLEVIQYNDNRGVGTIRDGRLE